MAAMFSKEQLGQLEALVERVINRVIEGCDLATRSDVTDGMLAVVDTLENFHDETLNRLEGIDAHVSVVTKRLTVIERHLGLKPSLPTAKQLFEQRKRT